MMKERFIYLVEKFFDREITNDEKRELQSIVNADAELKKEFEEQKRVKEVLKTMTLSNPSKEIWDSYWMNIYNKIERKFAWLVILIGTTILLGLAAIQAVEQIISDIHTPWFVKFGIFALVFGFLILLFSIIREKFSVSKVDKYKEIQR